MIACYFGTAVDESRGALQEAAVRAEPRDPSDRSPAATSVVGTARSRGGAVDSPGGDVGLDLAESVEEASVWAGHESGEGGEDCGTGAGDARRVGELPVTDAVDERSRSL